MRKLLISISLATATLGTLATAVPAAAQRYDRGGFAPAREIRRDIDQLENRIERAARRGTISRREAVSLRRQANRLEIQFSRFSRNGLDRGEIRQLRQGIDRVQAQLREERRDRDRRRN